MTRVTDCTRVVRVETDGTRKFVDAVAEILLTRVKTDPSGVKSLAHLLVVVPTAQSGRRLRLALSRRVDGGILPPDIRQPFAVLSAADEGVADRTDELVAFFEAGCGSIDIAAQLSDIRRILGADALSFADVAGRVGGILTGELADIEVERWRKLAETETKYRDALAKRGKRDRIEMLKNAVEHPDIPREIEEVILAGVLDPLPLLGRALKSWGGAVTEIAPGAVPTREKSPSRRFVFPCGTTESESAKIATFLSKVGKDDALPSLCLADPEIFTDIQGALQANGIRVHNPDATPVVMSSLGHIVRQLTALLRTKSFAVFSSFIRSGDARRWISAELGLSEAEMTEALNDLDKRQAELLPEKIDDIGPKTQGKLRAIFEFIGAQLRKKGLRALLQSLFRGMLLDERDADCREFAAAAQTVDELLESCFAPSVSSALSLEIFERRLEEATYSLEPDEGDVILTDGWLEVPFLDADELVIAGFREGAVPESVVGHPFLPDSLRRGLGLPDNESRAARDAEILRIALACRRPEAVRIYFHAVNAHGDVCKPSRLLFATDDDAELAARVSSFYGVRPGTEEAPAADFPERWRLRLAIPPDYAPLEHASPSKIDDYLKCPFTYYLKRTFGERLDDNSSELDASEFGSLAHGALENWANGPLRDETDPAAIAAELAVQVDAILGERFGTSVPAIVALQGESLKRRLKNFAAVQVKWRQEGWKIVATERKLEVTYDHTRFHGRCDRIDYNEQTRMWCVVDYKTWDKMERKGVSLQLPIYCAMLDACPDFPDAKLDSICSAYCVIGKSRDESGFTEPLTGALVPEKETLLRETIGKIERGIFWPPAKSPSNKQPAWKSDFSEWMFGESPSESVDPAWIADQERRIAAEGDKS